MKEEKEIREEIQKLVLARIKASSNDLRISVGSKDYTREEMLKFVQADNEIGREIMDIQMEYLRDVAQGAMYQTTNE